MPKFKKKISVTRNSSPDTTPAQYRGKQAKTGNSLGFRLDRSFFKSHAEFNDQEVKVTVIAPGRALISVDLATGSARNEDPLVGAYLAFLAKEITRNPQAIRPLSASLVRRMRALTHGITTDPQEDLGDEALL
jgi:prlF antitoxin for toxin YhaV_toxin